MRKLNNKNMDLEAALLYTQQKINEGNKSDGCTLAPDLGIKHFCVMHDMLRRFKPVSAFRADNLFFQGIITKGFRYYPVAVIYWLAVRWVAITRGSPAPSMGLLGFIVGVILLAVYG